MRASPSRNFDVSPIVGAVSRKGNVVARVVANVQAATLTAFVREAVSHRVSLLCTDQWAGYNKLGKEYPHGVVDHGSPGLGKTLFNWPRKPAARGVYPPRRTCRPGVVELGVLTIDKAVPDSLEAQKKLLFLPGLLTDGIEPSDDPLIGLRDGAYAVSFSRRNP
jgi:hypothetical protein